MPNFDHMLRVSLHAATHGPGVLSTGERLAAALVLNRPDWLAKQGYSIPDALSRIGADWANLIPKVADAVIRELSKRADAKAIVEEGLRISSAFGAHGDGDGGDGEPPTVDFTANLRTYGSAPGYRDVTLVFDLVRAGHQAPLQAALRISADDSISILEHINQVHALAWSKGQPIDATDGESKPCWVQPWP